MSEDVFAPRADRPTVVLVHGAFAESSSWNGVVDRLRNEGLPVLAVANPLRGLEDDARYLRGVIDRIDGPVVVAGHSYGGRGRHDGRDPAPDHRRGPRGQGVRRRLEDHPVVD